ncbi:WD40 repeat domain-containing protein [Coleofasciculus sp. FACHB-SPT9]|uniref:WD40 repeat domain-containing protein n=1 Tax=Cyanophyceae TaxID=3028117 RepID=UPI001686F245|nr:WD40 repeat domain-containing protein [Coleofasciculus sp. FACHB-SPT9]MBD1888925.1 WD40 repeat domain-containing protein [Coleofasciculus sp. FACHB-SPT9]
MKNLKQLSWKNAIARSAAPKAIALAVMATIATGAIAKLPSTAQPSTQPSSTTANSKRDFEPIYNLSGHNSDVTFLTFNTNSQILVSHSPGGALKLWNLKTGKLLRTLNEKIYAAGVVAITPDTQTLVTVDRKAQDNDKTIKVWNLKTNKLLRTLNGHSQPVNHLEISADGQTLVSASNDKKVLVWNLKTGKRLQTINPQSTPIRSIALSPNSQILATGGGEYVDQNTSTDTSIQLWDIKTGKLLGTLEGQTSPISSIAIAPDGQTLVSVADSIKIWNLRTKQLLHTIPGGSASISISPDGQKLVTAAWDHSVKLWNLRTGALLKTLFEPSINDQNLGRIYTTSIAFSPDGKMIAIGSGGVLSTFGISVLRGSF